MTVDHGQAFVEEARELLAELENSLLELEETPDDKELIGSIFRAMHTIKGSGAMFGFDDIAAFTHEVESIYDKVRDGQIPVTKELIDLTLHAKDRIRIMLDGPQSDEAPEGPTPEEIVAAFQRLASGTEAPTYPIEKVAGLRRGFASPLTGSRRDLPHQVRAVPEHLPLGDEPPASFG